MRMKKGDLVKYEYVAQHRSGVGWEFHREVGVIVDYNAENDSFRIMTNGGKILERLDMQIELIARSE